MLDKLTNRFSFILATGFGLGLIPKAPGTFGSLLGIPLGVFLYGIGPAMSIPMLIILTLIGTLIIKEAEKSFSEHDPSAIVIDEIIGQAIPFLFIEPTLLSIGVGFLLFRIFDIVKKGPVGYVDRNVKGAFGVMADDLVAGLMALLVMLGLSGLGLFGA